MQRGVFTAHFHTAPATFYIQLYFGLQPHSSEICITFQRLLTEEWMNSILSLHCIVNKVRKRYLPPFHYSLKIFHLMMDFFLQCELPLIYPSVGQFGGLSLKRKRSFIGSISQKPTHSISYRRLKSTLKGRKMTKIQK